MRPEISVGDPIGILPPVLEPQSIEKAEFQYRKATRDWWMRVGEWKCQYEFYDERHGWQECDNPADQVHHIIAEEWQLQQGDDPERSVGLPLCIHHHVKNESEEEHSQDFSFHPDMGQAYKDYAEWKANELHMNSITGRKTIDYSTSPFVEAAQQHVVYARGGIRYWQGTPEIDQYYIDKMIRKAAQYYAQTGDRKPQTSPHVMTDRSRKKKWHNGLF